MSLIGYNIDELTALLGSRTRAIGATLQLFDRKNAGVIQSLDGVAAVSNRITKKLGESNRVDWPVVHNIARSADNTTKYALAFGKDIVETVRIPTLGRSTICVSSQVGCTRKCQFCATQTLGFGRNLKAAEIVAQYLIASKDAPDEQPARNVVFMGMGEPMDNLDEVLKAVDILLQNPLPMLKASQVTVSTSGVLPGMQRFLKSSKAALALSLNGTTDEQRTQIMPHNKTWPIESLLGLLREDAAANPGKVHFIEYVLFGDFNDSSADADRLAELLRGLPCRINLIPHNTFEGNAYGPPREEVVVAFHAAMVKHGYLCFVRWPKGREVAAACGQLARVQSPAAMASSL